MLVKVTLVDHSLKSVKILLIINYLVLFHGVMDVQNKTIQVFTVELLQLGTGFRKFVEFNYFAVVYIEFYEYNYFYFK